MSEPAMTLESPTLVEPALIPQTTELLIGCGKSREKKIRPAGRVEWGKLVTLDMNPDNNPDVVHDLEVLPYPFADNSFDEIHAYDVLEHQGKQGDWRFFFAQWSEFYRILKPDGRFCGVSPHHSSPWAWGDPGHTRVISEESFIFLNQMQYRVQQGKTPMTDYRFCWQGDMELTWSQVASSKQLLFLLRAHKPGRVS